MKFVRFALLPALLLATSLGHAADKRILLLAGKPSHGPGDHEFRAGCLLLQQCLDPYPGVQVEVYTNGWPADEAVFAGAAAVLIYADGGGGHPAIQGDRIRTLDALAARGVGIGCAHYGVEVPAGGEAQAAMWRWIGGHYEHEFSVNPMWEPDFDQPAAHPIARGVGRFQLLDEWYFNMRWRPDDAGLTHLLVDAPSDDVRDGPYVHPPGPYPHIVAASGRPETMMWAFERPDGGRGFGFTGGHKHVNWYEDNFRKVVLNALLWIAQVEVPANGVESSVLPAQMAANLDPKQGAEALAAVTGTWRFDVRIGDNGGQPTMELVQAGKNLLGRYEGYFGQRPLKGFVDQDRVRLIVRAEWQGQDFEVVYAGKAVADGRMEGTVSMGGQGEGTWTATRMGDSR